MHAARVHARRSGKTANRQSDKATKRRSGEAAKRQSNNKDICEHGAIFVGRASAKVRAVQRRPAVACATSLGGADVDTLWPHAICSGAAREQRNDRGRGQALRTYKLFS